MDPFAAFVLATGSVIALSNHAVLMEHYAARARYPQPVVVQPVVVQPAWEPAPPIVYGAAPPVTYVLPPQSFAEPPPSLARSAATRDFTQHWQSFIQPSTSRCPCPPSPRN